MFNILSTTDTHNTIDDIPDRCWGKKTDMKNSKLHDSIYMKFNNMQNESMVIDIRVMVMFVGWGDLTGSGHKEAFQVLEIFHIMTWWWFHGYHHLFKATKLYIQHSCTFLKVYNIPIIFFSFSNQKPLAAIWMLQYLGPWVTHLELQNPGFGLSSLMRSW